jgi:peptide methionine sulfoxide reductase MsrB
MPARAELIRQMVDELVAAGATSVRKERHDAELGHVVMLDPEGNEFCVA